MNKEKQFLWSATAAVAISIVAGLITIDSPWVMRDKRLDAIQVDELVELSQAVDRHFRKYSELPGSLADLMAQSDRLVPTENSDSGQPYRYSKSDGGSYKLCADFHSDNTDRNDIRWNNAGTRNRFQINWAHSAGSHCFEIDVSKH